MPTSTRTTVLAALCLFAVPALHAWPAASVSDRVSAQNALFEEQWESDLRFAPERATAVGDYRYNDKLSDRSLASIAQRHGVDEGFLQKLKAIPTDGFTEQDQLSHDLLLRSLQQRIDDYDLKDYEMPVDQMSGPHTGLADLPLSVPLDSVKHYEDYIARLHQIPRVFTQTEEVMRAGMKDNLMPVKFLLEKVPAQCQGVISADPFLAPTKKYPASIPAGRSGAADERDHGRHQHRGPAGVQELQRLCLDRVRASWTDDAVDRVVAGRGEAVSERDQGPHDDGDEARRDPRDRAARD